MQIQGWSKLPTHGRGEAPNGTFYYSSPPVALKTTLYPTELCIISTMFVVRAHNLQGKKGMELMAVTEKAHAPARQSELSSQVNTKSVVSEILNTEVQLGKLLGASKEISLDLQERLRPWNRTIESHQIAAGVDMLQAQTPGKALLTLPVVHNGIPLEAIIDTGSELNLVWSDMSHSQVCIQDTNWLDPSSSNEGCQWRDRNVERMHTQSWTYQWKYSYQM